MTKNHQVSQKLSKPHLICTINMIHSHYMQKRKVINSCLYFNLDIFISSGNSSVLRAGQRGKSERSPTLGAYLPLQIKEA